MDNDVAAAPVELDRYETLAKLYELRDAIERVIARRGVHDPRSEAERHWIECGHRLAFGCCAPHNAA